MSFRIIGFVSMAILTALLSACASENLPSSPATAPSKTKAQCLVCKYSADLACLDVDVDSNTPSAVYNGKTYYFCSRECHDEFLKNPEKYVKLEGK
jgi:YHS domain-containing protein